MQYCAQTALVRGMFTYLSFRGFYATKAQQLFLIDKSHVYTYDLQIYRGEKSLRLGSHNSMKP